MGGDVLVISHFFCEINSKRIGCFVKDQIHYVALSGHQHTHIVLHTREIYVIKMNYIGVSVHQNHPPFCRINNMCCNNLHYVRDVNK